MEWSVGGGVTTVWLLGKFPFHHLVGLQWNSAEDRCSTPCGNDAVLNHKTFSIKNVFPYQLEYYCASIQVVHGDKLENRTDL